jgi:hypothetical protein
LNTVLHVISVEPRKWSSQSLILRLQPVLQGHWLPGGMKSSMPFSLSTKKCPDFLEQKKCISETWAWVISGNKPCQVRFHAFFAMPTLALKLTWSLPSQFSKQQGSNKASWKFPVWYDDFPVAVSIGGFHSQRCLSLIPRGYIPYLEDWWWTWMNYTILGPTKNVSGMHRLHHFGALTCSCFLMVKLYIDWFHCYMNLCILCISDSCSSTTF